MKLHIMYEFLQQTVGWWDWAWGWIWAFSPDLRIGPSAMHSARLLVQHPDMKKKQINTLNLHTSSKSSMSISRNKGCRRNRWHNLTLAINIQIQRCLNKCPENINMMLLGHRIKSRYHGVTSSYQGIMSSYHGIASRCCCFWILGELLKGMWGELLKGMWGEISKVT